MLTRSGAIKGLGDLLLEPSTHRVNEGIVSNVWNIMCEGRVGNETAGTEALRKVNKNKER